MLIDTHSHINFKAFKDDAQEVVKRALNSNTWMIVVASELKSSRRAVEYAKKYKEGVYAAIGLHPFHVWTHEIEAEEYSFFAREQKFNEPEYEELLENNKVVAIGEIGLDYYRIPDTEKENIVLKQKHEFYAQLRFAKKKNLPCIIHCRQAHDDVISIFEDLQKKGNLPKIVMHCYSGDLELAKKYIDFGCLISFNGLITFASDWDETIKWLPLEKIMLETDCPYMTPVPFRGKRNEPEYVKYVAERLAELKGVSMEEIAEVTTKNAREFFKI